MLNHFETINEQSPELCIQHPSRAYLSENAGAICQKEMKKFDYHVSYLYVWYSLKPNHSYHKQLARCTQKPLYVRLYETNHFQGQWYSLFLFLPHLLLFEALRAFFHAVYGLPRLPFLNFQHKISFLLRQLLFGISFYWHRMKQRLGLAISLLGDPELLVLDEPINGLDPEGIVEFRNILERLNKQGITIFISSHILGELSKIATHYGIINEGVLVEELTAEELMAKRQSYLQINVANASGALELLKKELNTTKYELINENELHLLDMQDTGAVNYILSKNDFKVREIFLHHQDLEEYFLELMGGK